MASNKLTVSDLDFDNVKSNLKTFLQSQSEFQDYDFEGSGFAVLLDLLAYNTHYLGFNANMLANEMYLDSADIRKNIVSLAKMLGYTPTSAKAPTANIDITNKKEKIQNEYQPRLFDLKLLNLLLLIGDNFMSCL